MKREYIHHRKENYNFECNHSFLLCSRKETLHPIQNVRKCTYCLCKEIVLKRIQ